LLLWIKNAPTPTQIRDQLMDVESAFSKAMIEYAESCHQGGFTDASRQEVYQALEESKADPSHVDPTYSIPKIIPLEDYCDCGECGCVRCEQTDDWRESVNKETNEILFRTNLHVCNPRYCRANKYGTCKARMPRKVRTESKIDPLTGATRYKHLEAWMNDVCSLITYLIRCNHDCTSLLSGTAVNHIVYYITEYITKMGPQTHVLFDVIKTVFDRSSELTSAGPALKENARRLMTRLVNKLATKMELGAPMLSAYLLGNGDHYTSHRFKPFFWSSYFDVVRASWSVEKEDQRAESVLIMKRQGKVIAVSEAQNYIYRNRELETMKLYDFVRQCHRVTIKTANGSAGKGVAGEDSNAHVEENEDRDFLDDACTEGSDVDEDEDVESEAEDALHASLKNHFTFMKGHSMASTHCIRLVNVKDDLVLNFMRALPRGDSRPRDDYIMTMLMFFKPWRTGGDLKKKEQTWEEAFEAHPFTDDERQLMIQFNVRWECLDGRDDFQKLRANGELPEIVLPFAAEEAREFQKHEELSDALADILSPLEEQGYGEEPENDSYMRNRLAFEEMRTEVMKDGWHIGNNLKPVIDSERVDANKSVKEWTEQIFEAKTRAIEAMTAFTEDKEKRASNGAVIEDVRVVNKAMLTKSYVPPDHPLLIDEIVREYKLNEDQERAVRIVGNH
ncbi:hypothetical protein BD626DRAFT_379658, partial [Schizophyllum amplum]